MAADPVPLALRRPVPVELAAELTRRLYFVSPEIAGFELDEADGAIRGVRLTLDRPVDPEQLRRKVDLMVETDVLDQRRPQPAVMWCSARRRPPAGPAFADLVRAGVAGVAGDGQVVLGEPMVTLIDRLDGLLCALAVDEFGAVRMRYPTLLPTSVLYRSGYLTSFPHHVMFATRLHADLDVYHEFLRDAHDGADLDELVLPLCRTVDYCLPPTMCYHTFHQFAGRVLAEPTTVTARGSSFRFESRYQADLERLWDFTIREVVFLGDRPHVSDCRQRFLTRATDLLDALNLAGHAEVANDPFFASARTADAVSSQLMLALKYEARVHTAPNRTIAVGSFNLHDRMFTEPFDIRLTDGAPAGSACVGFGLERLAYAVVCQHGLAEENWPAPLRPEGGYREGSPR